MTKITKNRRILNGGDWLTAATTGGASRNRLTRRVRLTEISHHALVTAFEPAASRALSPERQDSIVVGGTARR
jgi:hypothetical protein